MTSDSMSIVGKRISRDDAPGGVSGENHYVDDLNPAGVLYGAVLRAGRAHARILSIDTSRAERVPGVVCVLTGRDVPQNAYGLYVVDQPVLCEKRVRYEGDPVVALCAESWEAAEEACRLIKVDYEDLPAVTDPEEALGPDSPVIHESNPGGNLLLEWKVRRGEMEKGFAEADFIVEERYHSRPQEHAAIEPHYCMAEVDSNGKVTVHVSSQTPYIMRANLAKVLRLPISKVRIVGCKVGGGFGGKHEIMLEPFAALCTMKTRRPVKFRMSREEEFIASTIRHSLIMDYKTGVTQEGRITAREIKIILDGGAYASFGETTASKAALMGAGPYRMDNLKVDAKLVYTNNGIAGAVRGFGVTQTTYACESHMDTLARRLEMDPLDFRLRNAIELGDPAHSGDIIQSCGLTATMEKATSAVRWSAIGGGKPSPCGTRRRGRGLAAMIYPVGFTATNNPSAAFARVNEDATLTLWTGVVDMGQGAHTILRQIAAEEMGIAFDAVQIVSGDSDIAPLDLGSVASRVTHIAGNAVKMAVGRVRAKLVRKAGEMLEASEKDIKIKESTVFVEGAPERSLSLADVALKCHKDGELIVSEATYNPPDLHLDKENGQGKPYDCYVFATHAAEVEVDIETGEYRVLRLAAAHDVGRAVNPMNVEGQIEGGALQGYGFGMMERIQFKDGIAQNPNFDDYLIPTSLDAPGEMETIIVETHEPTGPFGAKGVAEPALNPTTPAVLNAICDAVGARLRDLPATPEAVLRAMSGENGTG
ncbi:MAG: xanthine dehydrogenase family protein molybdopterin-binding subunit [Nitrospinaceae bacterium]|nr:xanthine dehydrogenase family protein molybdopterin-binding subunit [Nitrospinaceae bacterium]MBT3432385.1 xanthine dehydrogenase family protein molybdopterin-binding subunit [Nitrospinaceae bacterium]MBT3822966.1 xanthine dehydrogenase family protein molybdopterin-binding subunit [Nitrospinaceae bacterium]MBT4095587.1 xanthine dehydrogenase family protein molybdopterin-binding subunit [Nitrospinaceae bacterium]MBT4432218.1 xanthine dehydrogenase family protein molybdopterin-binding subunit 